MFEHFGPKGHVAFKQISKPVVFSGEDSVKISLSCNAGEICALTELSGASLLLPKQQRWSNPLFLGLNSRQTVNKNTPNTLYQHLEAK